MKCPICGIDVEENTPIQGICEKCFGMPSVKLFKIIIVMKGRIMALEKQNEELTQTIKQKGGE